jgi:hypothetical protein
MSDTSKGEAARAAREAQDAIVSRPRGSKGSAIDAALRRYLSAETYDEHRRAESDLPESGENDE